MLEMVIYVQLKLKSFVVAAVSSRFNYTMSQTQTTQSTCGFEARQTIDMSGMQEDCKDGTKIVIANKYLPITVSCDYRHTRESLKGDVLVTHARVQILVSKVRTKTIRDCVEHPLRLPS